MIKCTFEDGVSAILRHVVVDAIAINSKNQILLVKRAEHVFRGGKWGLPGGYLDRDERIKDAVVREVKEETNLKAKIIKLFKVVDNPNRREEERQNVCFVYIVSATGKPKPQESEVSQVKWFDLDKLPPEEDFAFDHLEIITSYLSK
jgi:mutator protein MutT